MTMSTKESPVKTLRLPEISRDAIARGLSEIQVPDLSKIERPSIEMPEIDLSKVERPRVDVGKAVADAAVAVGIARRGRPRWPFLVGAAVIAGLSAWALMHSTSVRERLDAPPGWPVSGSTRCARPVVPRTVTRSTSTPRSRRPA